MKKNDIHYTVEEEELDEQLRTVSSHRVYSTPDRRTALCRAAMHTAETAEGLVRVSVIRWGGDFAERTVVQPPFRASSETIKTERHTLGPDTISVELRSVNGSRRWRVALNGRELCRRSTKPLKRDIDRYFSKYGHGTE